LRVVALAGGTGSGKLLRGLHSILGRIVIVANTGDNIWLHGLYICPDIDIATYTLAGIVDRKKGWGIERDSFEFLKELEELGADGWFRLGDMDLATHLLRTHMLLGGKTLTSVTAHLARRMGVSSPILPSSDEHFETHIVTPEGEKHLQEFWVRDKGQPSVNGVRYVGADSVSPTKEVVNAIKSADRIIFCPGNPVTSIMPILSIEGMRELLVESRAKKVALSPMIGEGAFSGPAPKLMKAIGREPNSVGVAAIYSGFIDSLVIHKSDEEMEPRIKSLGIECAIADTVMSSGQDELRLSKFLLEV